MTAEPRRKEQARDEQGRYLWRTRFTPAREATPLEPVVRGADANLVGSLIAEYDDGRRIHAPVLDLDFEAQLVPSTTKGHYHLYLDRAVDEEPYMRLLDALAECGLIGPDYARFSQERGMTCVRPPGVAKTEEEAGS